MPPVTPRAINDTTTPNSQLSTSNSRPAVVWELASWALGVYAGSFSSFSTFRRRISRCAMVIFLSPSSRGSAPARSCRARRPARTTNSKRFSLGVLCMMSLPLERFDDLFGGAAHCLHSRPFGQDDRPDARHGGLELVVDDDVFVLGELAHLAAGHPQALTDLLFAVLAAAAKPLLEDGGRGREHEDAHVLDAAAAHLPRTLHVDHQHHVVAPH